MQTSRSNTRGVEHKREQKTLMVVDRWSASIGGRLDAHKRAAKSINN